MPDFISMKHAVEDFDKRNGADCIRIGGVLLYSNGAQREPTPHGLLQEPPTNPVERCQLTLKYRQEMLRRAVEEFNQAKGGILGACQTGIRYGQTIPPSNYKETLAELAKKVRLRRRQVIAAEWELEEVTPQHVKRANEGRARNQQISESVLQEAQKIRI